MTEERFWELIDAARRPTGLRSNHPSADPQNLRAVLAPMESDDIVAFMVAFIHRQLALNKWNLWGAGYVITGGMSDDSFHYFTSWIIGKGRACFDAAIRDPESLTDFIAIGEDVDNELLEYVAIEILDKRGVSDPRDLVADSLDEADPAGLPFDEDTVHETFPRLARKFG